MSATSPANITRNVTSSVTPANATSTNGRFAVTGYLVQGGTDLPARLEKETVLVQHSTGVPGVV